MEADNGRSALATIAAEHPRFVLLDIWMPEIDGIELLRQIEERHPGTSVIVISGHGNIETAVRATQLGAVDFIEKPFSLEGLLQRVERALGDGDASRACRERDAIAAPATPGFQGQYRDRPGRWLAASSSTAMDFIPAPVPG